MWHEIDSGASGATSKVVVDPSELGEHLERVTGIEPAFSAWEADVLPLNYTRGDGQHDSAPGDDEPRGCVGAPSCRWLDGVLIETRRIDTTRSEGELVDTSDPTHNRAHVRYRSAGVDRTARLQR